MESNFLCPKCRAYLNVGDNVIFSVKEGNEIGGVILLNKQVGNYKVITNGRFQIETGKHYSYFCPVCHADLAAGTERPLTKVLITDDKGSNYELLFSQIAGEHCTYILKNDKLETYGEDSNLYINHFGEVPNY